MRPHSRNLIALLLSVIATFSVVQTTGIMPKLVSADKTLSVQLVRAPGSTESMSASGNIKVNLESGQMTIDLKQASPNSVYQVVFATNGTNIQVGNITTGNGGEGHVETTLMPGTYVGIFQILRLDRLQFVTVKTSFKIGSTVAETTPAKTTASSVTTTPDTSSTQKNGTNTNSTTGQVQFQVEPPSRTINLGEVARFNIHIHTSGTANVALAAKNVPPHSVAIFTQDVGVANPEFHSEFIIVTSGDTPIGTYGATVISLINGIEFDAQVIIRVASSSTTTTGHTSISTSVSPALEVSISTNKHHYETNATPNIQGHVTDEAGNAVADASVSLQVDGPTGAEIKFAKDLKTDSAGMFEVSFKVSANASTGTYTIFISATKSGYAGATTHTTFVVGTSTTPSVVIREIYTSDVLGNRSAIFSAGQTVIVWVVVENSGAPFDGITWLQIRDATGTPISIQFQISPLGTGQTTKVAFGFQLTSSRATGVYSANALVSDKPISQGGIFFASANTEFVLTS